MTPPRLLLTSMLAAALLASCNTIEDAAPRARGGNSTHRIDPGGGAPAITRGTVGSECIILGWDDRSSPSHVPTVVRGYGLVVGLQGTGSGDIPPDVRAHMLQHMARMGIGQHASGWAHLKGEELLDSPDTAVVIVEGIVPQGAVGRKRTPPIAGRKPEIMPGTTFDILVSADQRTSTTSLEGGHLYTTDLRPGALMAGSRQAGIIAEGGGPIFINPFVNGAAEGSTDVTLRSGRVLNGGQVTKDLPLKLMLSNPSHTRARLIQDAINRRFPFEPGQGQDTAKGENDTTIALTVPPSMRDDTDTFVNTVMRTTLAQSRAELIANNTRRQLLADPSLASEAYWRWVALGQRALPFIRELYDHPEEAPRLVSLRAGAALADPIVGEPLRSMGTEGTLGARLEAAALMKELPLDPRTDVALGEMLEDDDLEVRLRSYEALRDRASELLQTLPLEGKFNLDIAPSSYKTIYVTQSRRPGIAVLGGDLPIDRPMACSTLGEQLMIREDPVNGGLSLRFRPDGGAEALTINCRASVSELVRALAWRPRQPGDPPGLNLSYGQTVGVLHDVWKAGYLACDFKAEQDRVLAELQRWGTLSDYEPRPDIGEAASDDS
ncbi:MAG: flagellar basal body P-ring protein FlgI [Phycisphaerales bacterium]|nr:flagellar basal body P-ring protein FlgI [Phycisphaerales bacterium]